MMSATEIRDSNSSDFVYMLRCECSFRIEDDDPGGCSWSWSGTCIHKICGDRFMNLRQSSGKISALAGFSSEKVSNPNVVTCLHDLPYSKDFEIKHPSSTKCNSKDLALCCDRFKDRFPGKTLAFQNPTARFVAHNDHQARNSCRSSAYLLNHIFFRLALSTDWF